jgi:hypothetical protein
MRVLEEDYYNEWLQKYESSKLEMIKVGLSKQKAEILSTNITESL